MWSSSYANSHRAPGLGRSSQSGAPQRNAFAQKARDYFVMLRPTPHAELVTSYRSLGKVSHDSAGSDRRRGGVPALAVAVDSGSLSLRAELFAVRPIVPAVSFDAPRGLDGHRSHLSLPPLLSRRVGLSRTAALRPSQGPRARLATVERASRTTCGEFMTFVNNANDHLWPYRPGVNTRG